MTERDLPHHRLVAFTIAKELLGVVDSAKIADLKLRDQAIRAAKSACLNIAEGAGRISFPEKTRAFAIARGEACEAAAALEIAASIGECSNETSASANKLCDRLVALLTGLIRHRLKTLPDLVLAPEPAPERERS